MNFNIPIDKVEGLIFEDYNLMLFTIFNETALKMGGKFQYSTPDEQAEEVFNYAELAIKQGYDL